MLHVALDVVRPDGTAAMGAVRAAGDALAADPDLRLTLVGPARGLRAHAGPRVDVRDAAGSIGADEDASVVVRGRADASVRVAVDMVRAGEADAAITVGTLEAAAAAARFALRRLPGLRSPALAVPLRLPDDRQVLVVDAGGTGDATPRSLIRYAQLGASLLRAQGQQAPRVGVLAPMGSSDHATAQVLALFCDADLGPARLVGAVDTVAALAGAVDLLVACGPAGRVLTDVARALLSDAVGATGVLVGVAGAVGVLDPEASAAALPATIDLLSARHDAPIGASA